MDPAVRAQPTSPPGEERVDQRSRALAYAADTRLDKAIETAEAALTMAVSGARDGLANELRTYLEEWKRVREQRR